MPSNHLILCHALLLLSSIFPSIRVFLNESVLHIRWPKYWSFSFNISLSNEYSVLISFIWTGWIPLQSKGLSRIFSNATVQSISSSVLSFLYGATLTSIPKKAMAPHSSTFAWKTPWMAEPGRLQSMGSLRVRYNWATSLSLFTFMHWRRKWQPTPVFLPGESQGWQSLVGCPVYGVVQSQTRLKWLSSSSSSSSS